MNISRDEIMLETVRLDISAGLTNISSQMTHLAAALLRGGDGCRERIDLLALEGNQARLRTKQSATLNRIAKASAAPVVLVVDDEPIVLMSAADQLTSAGFSVVEVSNADQAIEALECDASISAVFTDVQMRGSMNGLELMRIVHLRWPEVRVVVTSGNQMFGQRDVAVGDHFIRKPYAAEDVANALRAH